VERSGLVAIQDSGPGHWHTGAAAITDPIRGTIVRIPRCRATWAWREKKTPCGTMKSAGPRAKAWIARYPEISRMIVYRALVYPGK